MPRFKFSSHVKTSTIQIESAEATVKGTAPFRAGSHCEPFRIASKIGWWLYPHCDFSLKWDGDNLFWLHANSIDWASANYLTMENMAMQSKSFKVTTKYASNLLSVVALPEPGYVQIWTGLTCYSDESWCSLVRSVPNFANSTSYESLEGVIETDWWHGPLLINIRIRRTNSPIHFRRSRPIAAIQPISRDVLRTEQFKHNIQIEESDSELQRSMKVRELGHPGGYSRISRRRARKARTFKNGTPTE